jgi:HEAT repeat protein
LERTGDALGEEGLAEIKSAFLFQVARILTTGGPEYKARLHDSSVLKLLAAAAESHCSSAFRVVEALVLEVTFAHPAGAGIFSLSDTLDALRGATRNPDAVIRRVAIRGLSQHYETLDAVVRLLRHDPDPSVRSEALNALAAIPGTVEYLADAALDPRPAIRNLAGAFLKGPEALNLLETRYKNGDTGARRRLTPIIKRLKSSPIDALGSLLPTERPPLPKSGRTVPAPHFPVDNAERTVLVF